MKRQTAVRWLIDKHFGGIENCTPDFRKHIEQALEMEKEQIKDANTVGVNQWLYGYKNAEEYFTKIYKQ